MKVLVTGEVLQQWSSCDTGHPLPVDILQIGVAETVEVLGQCSFCDIRRPANLEVLGQGMCCKRVGHMTLEVMQKRRSFDSGNFEKLSS